DLSRIEPNDALLRVDQLLRTRWHDAGVSPAPPADDLTILRRLSLALRGTIPSLEEIREFEGDDQPRKIDRWTQRLLADPRFAEYFSARLSRVFVGADDGQFLLFRRDRFQAWLSAQFQINRPYDEIVREIISEQGLWTGSPATNFVTAAVANNQIDPNELAGRTVRAFLGQRMDCAHCHNHPFAEWKQSQFEGLAACFGQVRITAIGIEDDPRKPYAVEDRNTLKSRAVEPVAPFHPEWFPDPGTLRQRLAVWVTHPDNRRFERAAVNRIWGLLFGRPWQEPVDDLPNPQEGSGAFEKEASPDLTSGPPADLLDILGQDFREQGYDLHRLIGLITATEAFRLSSAHPMGDLEPAATAIDQQWAAFPLTRLRPEQVIGSMNQAASLQTADQRSLLLFRLVRLIREIEFVKEYGDLGDEEFTDRAGTIPQALLRMNGRFAKEMGEANLFNAAGRISAMSPEVDRCIETCFLVCLTRRPTPEELRTLREAFEAAGSQERSAAVEDLVWSLFNSPEFSWSH
ncbi:MAG: DUF1549 domain-containing protein, partial [Planctomycetaceae bacterium]